MFSVKISLLHAACPLGGGSGGPSAAGLLYVSYDMQGPPRFFYWGGLNGLWVDLALPAPTSNGVGHCISLPPFLRTFPAMGQPTTCRWLSGS